MKDWRKTKGILKAMKRGVERKRNVFTRNKGRALLKRVIKQRGKVREAMK